MDSRQNKGFIIPGLKKEKEEKVWKWSKSKEGDRQVRIPASMRIRPNKYNPRKGKRLKNEPYCYKSLDFNLSTSKCKSCMWRFTCVKKELSIPSFQDSTGGEG
jgi:hypothetical protein